MKKEYLSPSKLKRFRTCPHQCQFEEFKRSAAVDFGNCVHKGLAAYYSGKDFLTAYRGEAGKLGVPQGKEAEAVECFEYSKSLNINPEAIVTVESADGEVEFYGNKYTQVDICDEFGFRGAMDLVYVENDGGLVIRDHKTGRTKEEDDLQLAMYALMAWKKYRGFPYIKTVFDYVQQGFSQVQSWDAESLVSAFDYVVPLAKDYLQALREKKWPQTPHKWCSYCDLKSNCDAFQKQLAAKPDRPSYDIDATVENLPAIIEYHDKVKSIADAAYSIQAMMKEKYEKVLLETGPVNLGGRTYEIREKTSRYNHNLSEIFLATGKLIGRPPVEICEFSSGGAKEFRKSLDKDQKKAFDAIVEGNREVKSRSKTLSITIAKGAVANVDAEGAEVVAE